MTILTVAFFREIIGRIDTDGPKGNWQSANTPLARFLENSHPGELPNTFKYLQPEGWLAGVLEGKNYIELGVRFLSNLTIIEEGSYSLDKIGIDTLHAHLRDSTADGTFTGTYHGPSAAQFSEGYEKHLSGLWNNSLMPKFSGAQVKLPVSLLPDENGGQVILPAVHTPFSHILKVPREGFYASLPAVEWMGLELARRAGLETADHALVEMPNGMAPALIVERFDIPHVEDELRHLTRISDFCNLTDLSPRFNKYETDVSVCFQALEAQSSDPEADRIALFKRIALSHYILDADMHLKNISVLKTIDRETGDVNVRLSPAYDAMTTMIYPELSDRTSALHFDPDPDQGGRCAKPYDSRSDLIVIAGMNGIPWEQADAILDEISQSVVDNAVDIARNPPEVLKSHPACLHALKCAATEIVWRSDAENIPEWGDDEIAMPREYKEEAKIATSPTPIKARTAFNGPTLGF